MAVQNSSKSSQADDFIRIQDLFFLCLARWRWFVLSLIVIMGLGVLYILTTPPTYTRSASILVKVESKGKSLSSDLGSEFANMGLFNTNTNVNNELFALQSPTVMEEVVRILRLNVHYFSHGRFYRKEIYGQSQPVTVFFLDIDDTHKAELTLDPIGGGGIQLSQFQTGEEKFEQVLKGRINDTIQTPVGRVIVSPNQYSNNLTFNQRIYVSKDLIKATTAAFSNNLDVSLADEGATVINLTVNDVSIQRAEDVLNTLISVYNDNWVKDRNQIAVSTSYFIGERLEVIESELGSVDEDISTYKSQNLLPDVQAASSMYMAQSSETNSQILALNTQLSMAKYVRSYLTKATNLNQLLPANSGLESNGIDRQIVEYNSMQLQRNSLVSNSSEQNPLVKDLDQSLATLRGAIVSSIDNLIVTINTRIRDLQQSEQQTTARIAASPTQAKYLLSVERQQKVKEALYLFLLQKREENELSQAFTAYNTRLLTPPTGSNIPTAPVKRNILLVAFVIAMLIPTATVFLMETMNTSVRGRKDIESLSMPFVGEIPLSYRRKHRSLFKPKAVKNLERHEVVVKEHSRNVINEAFRVVRTNLEFMVGKEGKTKIIMISSVNSGSGKTFLSMNLATSLAIKGKRVLAVDLDLRKASLSAFVDRPKTGISDYLAGNVDDYSSLIVRGATHPSLDILPVGTMPPNPTELLFADSLKRMLDEVRSLYDYVFIDCPPVEIVADASIITKYSDLTLFIIRAGLLDRAMLPEIERYYTDRKYNNMALILNGTEGGSGRYGYKYGYKYGYRYGYKYGYNYGYGGYAKDED